MVTITYSMMKLVRQLVYKFYYSHYKNLPIVIIGNKKLLLLPMFKLNELKSIQGIIEIGMVFSGIGFLGNISSLSLYSNKSFL